MTATLVLWGHALAGLLFGALTLIVARETAPRRRALAVALAASGMAALAVAGLGMRDVGTGLIEAIRDAAWVTALILLLRRHHGAHPTLVAIGASILVAALAAVAVAVIEALPQARDAAATLIAISLALRMTAVAGGLVLVHHAAGVARRGGDARGAGVVLALALLWSGDLALTAVAWSVGGWPQVLVAARGAVLLLVAAVAGAAIVHRRGTPLAVSRAIAWRLIAGSALAAYAALIALASGYAAGVGGAQAQTAVVVGGGAALLTLVSTPWLRAWARVTLAKHLFGHRYDYRAEWQRFTAALAGSDPLGERIVRAMAGFTDSPGGLLMIVADGQLVADADWCWAPPGEGGGAEIVPLLAKGWMVELDRVRDGTAGEDERRAVPAALAARIDAWAIVPLIHDDALVAAIVLARPPVDRALDWEDFDLLRVAGRQAASHLAEERARTALAEARRFDEFNRRFAFIMHDLKNLVSQMTLTASNARRHADNPAFRADMVATLGDCAERMTGLIARLSSHGDQPAEPIAPTDLAAVARAVARRFAHHPVAVTGRALAMAHPARLEQVLAHLVQNAVEASAADAAVTIAIEDAAIVVIDRGVGMSAGFVRDELFRPFASSKPGGFGLGAFEARQLVAAMGGTLSVDSRAGEGTRFCITLTPVTAMEEAA